MSGETADPFEPGVEVWVLYRRRWRRGPVVAVESDRVRVSFRVRTGDAQALESWFALTADPAVVLAGSYARPVRLWCQPCGVLLLGAPGQPAEQVMRGHADGNLDHAARKAQQAPASSRPRLEQLVKPNALVWVSRPRWRVIAHRYVPGADKTPCDLWQAEGTTLVAADAVNNYRARSCRGCWPGDA